MKKKAGSQFRTVFAHIVLILLSFMCLFFFYVLIINATRSHGDLQKGFSALPGKYFLENLKNVANDGSFPMFRGILNSVIVSSVVPHFVHIFHPLRHMVFMLMSLRQERLLLHLSCNSCNANAGYCNGIPSSGYEDGII